MIGFLYVVGFIVGLVLLIGWIVLPFAVIGTKPLLAEILEEQEETNKLLNELLDRRGRPDDRADRS